LNRFPRLIHRRTEVVGSSAKILFEPAKRTPAHNAIIDNLRGLYLMRRSRPQEPFLMTKTILLDHSTIINSRNFLDNGNMVRIPRNCALATKTDQPW
jgi:hypothetical protein